MSIFNQNTVDTLAKIPEWLDEHFKQLRSIRAAIEDQTQTEHFTRMRGVVALDANGNGQIIFTVSPGYDWSMERVTVTSTGNGMCQVYLDSVNPTETVEIIGSSQIYSDAFNNNVFVAQGSKVIFNFTSAGASGQATVNLQVKLLKRAEKSIRTLKAYDE